MQIQIETTKAMPLLLNARTMVSNNMDEFLRILSESYAEVFIQSLQDLESVKAVYTVYIDDTRFDIPKHTMRAIKVDCVVGRKIEAIKTLRAATNCSLKGAKDFVEQYSWDAVK